MMKFFGFEYDWKSEGNTQERFIYIYSFLAFTSRCVDAAMFWLIATRGVLYEFFWIAPIFFVICAGTLLLCNLFYRKFGFPLFPAKEVLERKEETADFICCLWEIGFWVPTLVLYCLNENWAMEVGRFAGRYWGQPIKKLAVFVLGFVYKHDWLMFFIGSLTIEPDVVTLVLAKENTITWRELLFITLPSSVWCIAFYSVSFYFSLRGFEWWVL